MNISFLRTMSLLMILALSFLASCAPVPHAPIASPWQFRADPTGAEAAQIINTMPAHDQNALYNAIITLPPDTKSVTPLSCNPNPLVIIRHPDPGFEILLPTSAPNQIHPITWMQGQVRHGVLQHVHVSHPYDFETSQEQLGLTYGNATNIPLSK